MIDESKKFFKIVQYITYAISKMHQIYQKRLIKQIIKFFQMLHFDFTINNINFDETNCIIHFIDKYLFFI